MAKPPIPRILEIRKAAGDVCLHPPPLAAPARRPGFNAFSEAREGGRSRGTQNFGAKVMAQVCDICGKGPQFGNNISHAHNVTRRSWSVNLQAVKALVNGHA